MEQTVQQKPIKERLNESMDILRKIQELGIVVTDPGYVALSKHMNEWIKGGETWKGNVDFHRWNRRAEVMLPTKPGTNAKCVLKHHVY